MKKSLHFIINFTLSLVVFFVVYICAELCLAPILSETVLPQLKQFYFIQTVDHNLPKKNKRIPTNSDGIRDFRESGDFQKNGTNIIFLGDSFVYGYTDYNDTIPVLIEDGLKRQFPNKDIKVANFGWASSSPLLDYRFLQKIGHKYYPKIILLGFDMTDFQDDIKYRLMLNKEGIYYFYNKIPIMLFVLKKFFPEISWKIHSWSLHGQLPRQRFFMTENPLSETKKYLKGVMENIEGINKYAKEHQAEFVLIIFPRYYQYNAKESPDNWEKSEYTLLGPYCLEPFRYFNNLKSSVSFPIYSLLEDFQNTKVFPTCFNHDPHWNKAGNRVAANAIIEILKSKIDD